MANLSTPVLSREEQRFYGMMRLRAVSEKFGQPSIRAQIFNLIPISSPSIDTARVDTKSRVYINFEFMQSIGIHAATQALIHEAWHVLRNHHARYAIAGGNALAWNIAADCEINDDIKDAPEFFWLPSHLKMSAHLLAEQYLEAAREHVGDNQGDNSSGDGDSSDSSGSHQDTPESPKCGSGAGNDQGSSDYELKDGQAPQRSESEQAITRVIVAEQILRDSAGKPGDTMLGQQVEWARVVRKGKEIPWQRLLTMNVTKAIEFKAGDTDFSWGTRSRIADSIPDAVIPGDVDAIISVAVAVDTSASNMGNLGLAVEQVDLIMRRADIKGDNLLVFPVESRVGQIKVTHSLKDLDLTGGGGTDMREAIKAIAQMRQRVQVGIIITDGETPWPEMKPAGKTSWIACIIPNSYMSSEEAISRLTASIPSWMKFVIVK